jgi:glycosyltransferase 2 family protein
MQPRVRNALIFLLTLGLLGVFLRSVNVTEVWAETRRANPWFLVLAVAFTGLTYAVRALRWQYLLAPIGPTHFSTAFRTTVIGFAASFLLPARAGEVLRPYLLARREGLNATAAFATIILERLLDLITVLLLFAYFVLIAAPGDLAGDPAQFARIKLFGLAAAGAALAGSAVFFILAGHPERMGRLALGIERVLPARLAQIVARFVETFSKGLAVMRQPRRMLIALVLSVPLWLAIASGIWLTSQAFHITFPFRASFLVTTVLVVGVAVPTPGAVGGFHLAYQFAAVVLFGVPADRAAGAAIVLHAISFIPVTLLGIYFMARDGLTLAGARRMAAEQPGKAEPPMKTEQSMARPKEAGRAQDEERRPEPDAGTTPPVVRRAEGPAR